jgi:S1-C subfamily serine protease
MRPILPIVWILAACNCRLPADETPQDVDALAARIGQIVHIDACTAAGSGVNLGNGYVLTALHVVTGCPAHLVTESISERSSPSELDTANRFDLALLKLETPMDAPRVTVARVAQGDTVCKMAAAPLLTVRCGVVLEVRDGKGGIRHSIQTDKGNSGGGLYDQSGNLVGIVSTCNTAFQGSEVCIGSGGGATAVYPHAWMVE